MRAENLTATPGISQSKRDGTTTVTLAILCQVFHGLTFGGLALFLPLIRDDLQISFAQAGMLSAAATLSYGLGQIPAGFLSDRYGPKRLFFIGLLGWSALSLSLGLIHAFWLAVLNLLAAGAFRALMFAPGLSLLASWFPPERRATAMSLYMVGGFSGTILVSLAGPFLAQHLGWRYTFILFAALGMAAALVFRSHASEKPRRETGPHVGMLDALRLFRHRILWVCSAIQFIRFSVVTAFNFWLPSLLVTDRGFSLAAAGLVTAMSAAFTAPSNALGGYVSDRMKNPPLVIGGSLAVLACASTLLVVVDSVPVLLLVVATGSVFLQFYFGPLFFVPIEVLGQRTVGTAIGFSNLFANLGGMLSAYALGMVRDEAGTFTWGFIGISVLCLVGVVLSAVLARMRNAALAERHTQTT
ncbi:MAG: MFS transporter [Betaproteobacteria bacterium]|nr:MFS transporter [Betaproteobacteria bacterium]